MPDNWLERSGQRWKDRGSLIVAWAGGLLMAVGAVWVQQLGPVPILLGMALGGAAFGLRWLIRCRVCGVALQGSAAMRRAGIFGEAAFLQHLDSCPVCGDDGRATSEGRARWIQLGQPSEKPYWSWARLAVAAGLAVLILYLSVSIGGWAGLRSLRH